MAIKRGQNAMAKNQRGWLRKKKYADGMTWLFCFQVTRPSDGRRVENCKPIGLVADFPDEKAAWVEVGRLGLEKHLDNPVGPEPTFKEIAEHRRLHELRKEGIIGKKAVETVNCSEHNSTTWITTFSHVGANAWRGVL